MRIILQRVSEASVTVGGSVISSIGPGVMCLVGLHETDTEADVDYIVKTVLSAKVFADAEGRPWRQSVVAKGVDVLLVSQFTLYGTVGKKGNTDFHHAMPPDAARAMYATVLAKTREAYAAKGPKGADGSKAVQDGEFGALMNVALVNDGPVTLEIDDHSGPRGRRAASAPAAATALQQRPRPTPPPSPPRRREAGPRSLGQTARPQSPRFAPSDPISRRKTSRPCLRCDGTDGRSRTSRERPVRVFVAEDGKVARAPRTPGCARPRAAAPLMPRASAAGVDAATSDETPAVAASAASCRLRRARFAALPVTIVPSASFGGGARLRRAVARKGRPRARPRSHDGARAARARHRRRRSRRSRPSGVSRPRRPAIRAVPTAPPARRRRRAGAEWRGARRRHRPR